MAPSPPLSISSAAQVKSITGSSLLGLVFAWGLFGLLSCQIYIYSQAIIKDRLTLKILVYAIYAAQLTQIVLFTYQGFQIFVSGFGEFINSGDIRTGWFSVCILDGLVACAVQVFYARRVWILSERYVPSALILITSLISLVASLVTGAYSKSLGQLSNEFVKRQYIAVGVWETSAALCDIMIAGFTVYYLKCRSPEGMNFKRTSELVSRIIRMTIETGSLTASVAIATIIVTYLLRHLGYYLGFVCTISGLYATSFMAVLNSRLKYSVHTCLSTYKDGEIEVDGHPPIFRVRSTDASKTHGSLFADRRGVRGTVAQEEMALESSFKQPESEPHRLSNE